MWITRVSIANPVFAAMVMIALCVLGLFSYSQLRVERLPDIAPPVVFVSVAYPGASAEAVEVEVTKPVENLSGLQIDFLPPSSSSVVGVTVDPAPLSGAGVAVLEKIDGLTLTSSGTWSVVVRIGAIEVARQQVFVGEELATPTTS